MGNHAVSLLRRELRKNHNEIIELRKDFDDALNFDPDGLRKSERIQHEIEKRRKIIRDCDKAINLIIRETDAAVQMELFGEDGEVVNSFVPDAKILGVVDGLYNELNPEEDE
ncbi:hypothetical protein [Melghirimyces algeriensis]|uniref:Uncharacterized protein n=1 Tax=Melghirimyces algeriensis TaxID=910412 RepID=A0A521F7B6_9BACL|nr:hypothetical protein [Melghirimyces algeriensis]SMO92108.1 hypothetical protein SAMN06264849_11425 [Melghirimyces algeriensis]